MYSSTCYKIIAGKISLVEQSSANDDAVEIVLMEDEHSGALLKPVPMNSANTLPAVEESALPKLQSPKKPQNHRHKVILTKKSLFIMNIRFKISYRTWFNKSKT